MDAKDEIKLRKLIQEELSNDFAYKKWKRANVTIRGMAEVGSLNGGSAIFGDGLYTAFLSNREQAKKYGKVYFVVGAKPKHPKVFKTLNQAEIWLGTQLYGKHSINGFPDRREFFKHTTIEKEMVKLGFDGLVITGREIVNYTPDNDEIKYFEREEELKRYFYNNVKETGENNLMENENKKYKVFLDDERFPDWIYKTTDNNDWVICRDLDELKAFIEKVGIKQIKFLSFDNDLGQFENGENKPEGVDAVKWLVFDKEFDISDMDFNVHSANTARQGYIEGTLNNWKKELKRRKEAGEI